MEYLNIIVILVLVISPFFYVPYVVPKEKRQYNKPVWIIITFLLGLGKSRKNRIEIEKKSSKNRTEIKLK